MCVLSGVVRENKNTNHNIANFGNDFVRRTLDVGPILPSVCN